jgi:predicted transcriptional regulator
MNVLWHKGTATVTEVLDALPSRPPTSYSTVQTMLRILESKGYVNHEKAGRAFVYRPIVARRTARRRALRHLVTRLFEGSPALLVVNVLEDEHIGVEELKRLRQIIDEAEER